MSVSACASAVGKLVLELLLGLGRVECYESAAGGHAQRARTVVTRYWAFVYIFAFCFSFFLAQLFLSLVEK